MASTIQPSDIDHASFGKKAKQIYQNKYQKVFEEKYKGKYVAIHIESEEAFIGDTQLQAYYEGIKKHPNSVFFYIRIGLPPIKKRGVLKRKN